MEIRKMYTITNNGNEFTLIVGDYIRVRTKDENVIGRIDDLTNSYVTLEISSYDKSIYKSFLYVNLLEIEEYED